MTICSHISIDNDKDIVNCECTTFVVHSTVGTNDNFLPQKWCIHDTTVGTNHFVPICEHCECTTFVVHSQYYRGKLMVLSEAN